MNFKLIIILLALITLTGCNSTKIDNTPISGYLSCDKYDVDICPNDCVICPPSIEASSLGCQSQEFCESLGISADWYNKIQSKLDGRRFDECVSNGNPVMESYPRRCSEGEETYTEYIGNELTKNDLIRLYNPRPNSIISSPLIITGEARGNWYFEADFPVELRDGNDEVIAQGHATAKTDWMTEEFVEFYSELEFNIPDTEYGSLILKKDNPSGLSENDDYLEIPISFK